MKKTLTTLLSGLLLAYSSCSSQQITKEEKEKQFKERMETYKKQRYFRAFNRNFKDPKQQKLWDSIDNINVLFVDNDVALEYKEVLNELTDRGFYKTGDDISLRDNFIIFIDHKYKDLRKHFDKCEVKKEPYIQEKLYRHIFITDIKNNPYVDEFSGKIIQPTIKNILFDIPFMTNSYYKYSFYNRYNKNNVKVISEPFRSMRGQGVD